MRIRDWSSDVCSSDLEPTASDTTAAPAASDTGHAFEPAITAGDLAAHVERLASDEFEGRGPGTAGEQKTVEYIKAQMQRIGLQPGNNGDWYQRSEEHTSELQSLMRNSYAVFCLNKQKQTITQQH